MTAVEVQLCACSHAARGHERDEAELAGRGVCLMTSCGCTEYRPGSVEQAATVVAAAAPVVTGRARLTWDCGDCGQKFDRPQGLGSHRRYVHPKTAAAAAGSPSPEPDQPQVGVEAPAVAPIAAGVLAAAAAPAPVVVDPDDVLIGLVRALKPVVDGDASELVQIALDMRRYMDDRGWRVIDGGER